MQLVDEFMVRHPDGRDGVVRKYQHFKTFTGGGVTKKVPTAVEYLDDLDRSVKPLANGDFEVDETLEILSRR